VEWFGESGVMWGRVECSRGEWSDPAERGVVFPERLALGRNGPPYLLLQAYIENSKNQKKR